MALKVLFVRWAWRKPMTVLVGLSHSCGIRSEERNTVTFRTAALLP